MSPPKIKSLSLFTSVATWFIFLHHPSSALSNTGWRVALNIGREPSTQMPTDWASSGCRLPIVIKCDFSPDRQVVPKEDVIRFTGPDGEVVHKIKQGEWSLKNNRELRFGFEFPEQLSRRDVTLGPCTVRCEGLLYSNSDLKDMNDVFYRAREKTYRIEETVNEISRREEAPKKWNYESEQWEKRYPTEGLISQATKRIDLVRIQRKERNENTKRPILKDLSSDCGPFPGIDGNVYMKKLGVVTIRKGWRDVVIGTWSAEPINDKPVSYFY